MGTRTLITEAEFERLPDDGNLHELDEGEVIVMPPPITRHGFVQMRAGRLLGNFVEDRALGMVVSECGFRLRPDTVRAPDVAFVREERRSLVNWKGYSDFAPDLAVEILSPSDEARQLNRKIRQYLEAGTHTVWVLDADSQSVSVYERTGSFRMLGAREIIDAPELLPGFSIQVQSLFE